MSVEDINSEIELLKKNKARVRNQVEEIFDKVNKDLLAIPVEIWAKSKACDRELDEEMITIATFNGYISYWLMRYVGGEWRTVEEVGLEHFSPEDAEKLVGDLDLLLNQLVDELSTMNYKLRQLLKEL